MARHHHYFQCRYELAVTANVTLVYLLFLPPRLLLPFPDQLATTGLQFQCACTIDQQIPDSDYHLRLVMQLRHDVWMTGWLVFLLQRYLKKKQNFYQVFHKKVSGFGWAQRCESRGYYTIMKSMLEQICTTVPHSTFTTFLNDIFMQRNISYSLRHGDDAQLPKVRTTPFGVESIAYLGNKLWQNQTQEIKESYYL